MLIDTLKSILLPACIMIAAAVPESAHADRTPTWQEKERFVRTSLFAEDNPARYVGQEQFLQQQQQQIQREIQQQQYQQQMQYQQQRYEQQLERNNQRAAYQQQQATQNAQRQAQQRQQPAAEDEKVVGFAEDGSVKVRSGNKMVDQSAGDYLNRKFRSVLNTLWR